MNKTQKGFAVVEVTLLLVLVSIIAGTGYFVWHSKKQADKSLNTAANTNQTASSKSSSSKGSNPSNHSTNSQSSNSALSSQYLVITQWGVEMPITADIKDAYYDVLENNEGDPNLYGLSTHVLASLDSNCSATHGAVGIISRQTAATHDQNATMNDPLNSPVYPDKVGNYYYYFDHSHAACSNNQSTNSEQGNDFNLFATAYKSLKTVN
jgi:type II secretory pathway pseudopilin PulG